MRTETDQERRLPVIAEPTLEHYFYYLRRIEGDNRKAVQERRSVFEAELSSLLTYLERLSGRVTPAWEWPKESEDRHISQRIVRTDWLDNSITSRSYFVEARTYGDVYWLQVGYYQEGQAEPQIFASLHDEAWQPSAKEHVLGISHYLCGIATDHVDDLATRTLTTYIRDDPRDMASTRRADGHVQMYGSSRRPYTTVVFYPDAESEAWASRNLFNDIALRLELYKHKVDRQLDWCEHNWVKLSKQDQTLRDLLKRVKGTPLADAELFRRLIQLYRVYSTNIGMLAERKITIETNLDNLVAVLKDLEPLAHDHLVGPAQVRLWQRQKQLETDLKFADQSRQQADTFINTLRVEWALDRLVNLQAEPGDMTPIEPTDFPGGASLEAGIKPPVLPQVEVSLDLQPMDARDRALLQQVYRGFGRVLVKAEFSGGYSSARVLLILPQNANGIKTAPKITKLGPALALRQERNNYEQYVQDFLPFCAARLENDRYSEQEDRAGLNYTFVGGGALGQTMDLEEYYRRATTSRSAEQIVKMLDNLLDKELGQRWYGQTTPLQCFFSAEYGPHLVEHLRLKIRPKSTDTLWLKDQLPPTTTGHRLIEVEAIPYEHETIPSGALLSIEGMVVKTIKHGEIKLQDPNGQGIIVRVEFTPKSNLPGNLKPGDRVGVRGKIVYNRRGRMEQIVCQAFPALSFKVDDEFVQLPDVARLYPNPLKVYPRVLGSVCEGRQSYVHGDLHLRNVLVDEEGKGWLIDFAKVGKRHNLYDFVKLETYVRLMELARDGLIFSMDEYVQFEEALNDATLEKEKRVALPDNADLQFAYEVILEIRHVARKYMVPEPDFMDEYFRSLFLYCLAVMKYHQADKPHPTQLAFASASVLGRYLLRLDKPAPPAKGEGKPLASTQLLGTGNRWAMMVGVNEYDDRTNYGQLQVCVKDVHAVRECLVAGGFGSTRIRLLTDQTDEKPTRANILAALQALANAAAPDDLLLLYYSGHGDETAGESYLVARDGQHLVLQDTAVPVTRVKEILGRSAARAKVIILDACHSGADIGGKGSNPMSAEFIRRVFEQAEGLAILASCKHGEASYEWRSQEQSVFTHYMLEALQGQADRDEKGFVTVQDAHRHVIDGVKLWASQRNASQTPTLQYSAAGDIILVRYS